MVPLYYKNNDPPLAYPRSQPWVRWGPVLRAQSLCSHRCGNTVVSRRTTGGLVSWGMYSLWLEIIRKTNLALTFPASGSWFVLWPCLEQSLCFTCLIMPALLQALKTACASVHGGKVIWMFDQVRPMGKELVPSGDWTCDPWLRCSHCGPGCFSEVQETY